MIRNKKLELTSSTIGIFTTALFLISIFLPYFSIGDLDVSLYSIISTSGSNDWVGVLLLVISGSLLVSNSDKNIIAVLSGIGILFPLHRLYQVYNVTVDLPDAFKPSFGIGGYLLIIAAGIQLYMSLNQKKG